MRLGHLKVGLGVGEVVQPNYDSQSCARFNQVGFAKDSTSFEVIIRDHIICRVGDPAGPLNEGGVHPDRDDQKSEAMTHILVSTPTDTTGYLHNFLFARLFFVPRKQQADRFLAFRKCTSRKPVSEDTFHFQLL